MDSVLARSSQSRDAVTNVCRALASSMKVILMDVAKVCRIREGVIVCHGKALLCEMIGKYYVLCMS